MLRITSTEFETLVEEALADLPARFSELIDNVAIIVEEEPSADDLHSVNVKHAELLGIYRGVALPHRTHDMLPALPDTIAIFRGPILRVTRSREAAVRQIRDTVIHELGHYFGLSDHDMAH